jgi:hypothetical protein
LAKEILALRSAGEELTDCSPVVADLKLLWSVVATAVASECVQVQDISAISSILEEGIVGLDLYDYIDGGKAEVQRITDLLYANRHH